MRLLAYIQRANIIDETLARSDGESKGKGFGKGVSGRRKTKPETRGEDRSEQRRVQGNRGSAVAAVGQYRLYTT